MKEGRKGYCIGCGSHLWTLTQDIHAGMRLLPSLFKEKEGQGPWRNGDIARCRKCFKHWYNFGSLDYLGLSVNWEKDLEP